VCVRRDEVQKKPYRHVFPITGARCGCCRTSVIVGPKSKQILHSIGERRRRASIHSNGGDISETSAPEQIKAAIKPRRREFTAKLFFPKLAAFISSRRSPAFYIKQHTPTYRNKKSRRRRRRRAFLFSYGWRTAAPAAAVTIQSCRRAPRELLLGHHAAKAKVLPSFVGFIYAHAECNTHPN
jgi:hypothetical protein